MDDEDRSDGGVRLAEERPPLAEDVAVAELRALLSQRGEASRLGLMAMPPSATPGHSRHAAQAPALAGVAGMEMINEMFQRQARRLEAHAQQQVHDRTVLEVAQAQLQMQQTQLQWHTARYQERAEQVTKSSETIARMQSYVSAMAAEQSRSVQAAQGLARDFVDTWQHVAATEPQSLETISTSLSEIAGHVRFPRRCLTSPWRRRATPPPCLACCAARIPLYSLLTCAHR